MNAIQPPCKYFKQLINIQIFRNIYIITTSVVFSKRIISFFDSLTTTKFWTYPVLLSHFYHI